MEWSAFFIKDVQSIFFWSLHSLCYPLFTWNKLSPCYCRFCSSGTLHSVHLPVTFNLCFAAWLALSVRWNKFTSASHIQLGLQCCFNYLRHLTTTVLIHLSYFTNVLKFDGVNWTKIVSVSVSQNTFWGKFPICFWRAKLLEKKSSYYRFR